MDILIQIFGEGKDLTALQMCLRALVIFFFALCMIRVSGRRSFGMKSSFDNVIVILLGAVLSRAVVGASPFVPIICASLVLVLLHRLVAWLSIRSIQLNHLFNGKRMLLYVDGEYLERNMKKSLVCKEDIQEKVRKKLNVDDLHTVDRIYMEADGVISILKKVNSTPIKIS